MNLIKFINFTLLVFLFSIVIGCGKKENKDSVEFISVNNKVYYEKDYLEFMQMRFIYPNTRKDNVFPGKKLDQTLFSETIILDKNAKKAESQFIEDFEYKKIRNFFKGLYYQKAVIIRNMGFTDATLEDYFIKMDKKDPGYFGDPYFQVVREKVAEELFLETNEPDTSIRNYFKDVDDKALRKIWLAEVKKDIPAFFKKLYYKKYFGKDFPVDPKKIVGKDGIVPDSLVDMAINWLPLKKQNKRSDLKYRLKIANTLICTELFVKEAEKRGWYKEKFNRKILNWFEKYHRVHYYINNIALKEYKDNVVFDRDDFYISYLEDSLKIAFDDYYKNKCDSISNFYRYCYINEKIVKKRNESKLIFLKDNISDDFVYSVSDVYNKIEDYKNKRDIFQVEKYYNILNDELYFKTKGIGYKNLGEMFYENKKYLKAIKEFRNYIFSNPTKEEKMEAYNLIAFMYDEMGNNENAYLNYQWILKNFPGTTAAENAEFAMLHLGEPLLEPELYAEETKRQGL